MENMEVSQQLAALAMEIELNVDVDWDELKTGKTETYLMMATNVVKQLESVPDDQRAVVTMATMTKLLVENFILNMKMNGGPDVKDSQ